MMYIATGKDGNEYNLTKDQVEVWERCGYKIRKAEPKKADAKETAKKAEWPEEVAPRDGSTA